MDYYYRMLGNRRFMPGMGHGTGAWVPFEMIPRCKFCKACKCCSKEWWRYLKRDDGIVGYKPKGLLTHPELTFKELCDRFEDDDQGKEGGHGQGDGE